jgi:hypothetical protein
MRRLSDRMQNFAMDWAQVALRLVLRQAFWWGVFWPEAGALGVDVEFKTRQAMTDQTIEIERLGFVSSGSSRL